MFIVFSHQITNRLHFITDFLFSQLHNIPVELTSSHNYFLRSTKLKFNYSSVQMEGIPQILPYELLFETTVHSLSDKAGQRIFFEETPAIFPLPEGNFLPFDIFAASFYLISRYEEYLPFNADKMDRFPPQQSIAFRHNFLRLPIIDYWANKLIKRLANFYPEYSFYGMKGFSFLPTIDIDSLFAYKYKGVFRSFAGTAKDLALGRWDRVNERFRVWFALQNDPFDTITYIRNIHKHFNVPPVVFLQLSDYGKFDKNIPWYKTVVKQKARMLHNHCYIGIHPGFNAAHSPDILKREMERLRIILDQSVKDSRQHFLRIRFPAYYRQISAAGIKRDYSLGYPDLIGFRAGTSHPFYFFDLIENRVTSLRMYPFSIMDATLKYYLRKTPEESVKIISDVISSLKAVNGCFISVWHNESLSDTGIWKGWADVYEKLLCYANE